MVAVARWAACLRRPNTEPPPSVRRLPNELDLWRRARHDTRVAMNRLILLFALSLLGFFPALAHAAEPATNAAPAYGGPFPRPLDSYQDQGSVDAGTVLLSRALPEPFNLTA